VKVNLPFGVVVLQPVFYLAMTYFLGDAQRTEIGFASMSALAC
jgi:hypothetical protein